MVVSGYPHAAQGGSLVGTHILEKGIITPHLRLKERASDPKPASQGKNPGSAHQATRLLLRETDPPLKDQ